MEQRAYNGFVYQRASAGEPWTLVGPSTPSGPQAITIGSVDPKKGADLARTQQQIALDAPALAVAPQMTAAELEARRLANIKTARDLREQPGDQQFARGKDLRSAFESLPSVKAYTSALPVFASGLRSSPNGAGDLLLINSFAKVMDPTSAVMEGEARNVQTGDSWINATVARMKNTLEANGGKFSDEYRKQLREQMATRLGELNQIFIADRVKYKQIADRSGLDPQDVVGEHPGARYQQLSEQVLGRPQQQLDYDGMPIATGATKRQENPELQALATSLIRGGLPFEQVNTILRQNGASGDIDRQQFDTMRDAIAKGFTGPVADASREVPTTALNRLAASGPAVGFVGALNGAMLGGFDEGVGAVNSALSGRSLSDTIAEADRAKRAGAAAHPWWALGGNIAGGGLGMAAGGAAAGGLGLTAALGKYASLAGDLAFGALSGAGENNDNRLLGAGVGATGAAVGRGMFAAGAKAFGRGVRGVQDADVRLLANEGIPLTGGQILGGGFKAIEDAATSAPGLGQMIAARRGEGIDAANLAAFRIGGKPIGYAPTNIGNEGVRDLKQAVSNRYDAVLDPVLVQGDAPFAGAMAAARADAAKLTPDVAAGAERSLRRPFEVMSNNELSGRNFQQTRRAIIKDNASMAGKPFAHDFTDVTKQGIDAMEGLLDRQAPGVVPDYLDANAANRNLMTLAGAVDAGRNNGGRFTMAQLGSEDRKSTAKFLGRLASASGEGPFHTFQQAAQNVLPSKLPESGTAPRLTTMLLPSIVGGGLGAGAGAGAGAVFGDPQAGAGAGGALTVATLLASGALNTPAGRALAARALMERTPLMERIGTGIVNKATVPAGLFGRAAGTSSALRLLE